MSTNDPTSVGAAESTDSGELQRRFGDRWKIEQVSVIGVWSAMRKSPSGHHIRAIIGPSAAELLDKLETADVVEL